MPLASNPHVPISGFALAGGVDVDVVPPVVSVAVMVSPPVGVVVVGADFEPPHAATAANRAAAMSFFTPGGVSSLDAIG